MQKNSRKKNILIILGIILAILLLWFFVFLNKEQRSEIIEEGKNLFPFGQITFPDPVDPGGSQGTIGTDPDTQETGEETPVEPEGPRLRQVSDFPTGGFIPLLRVEEQEVADIVVDSEGNTVQSTRFVDVENYYVRYTSIEDGTVYETKLTPSKLEQEILIENFIPNSEYSYFSPDGNDIVYQYWNDITRSPETYVSRLAAIPLVIETCPFDFSPIELGDDEERIIGIHQFLNRTPQTRIARTGPNSPGNETSLVTEATLTAIKNFQSLYQLDIDGNLGTATRAKMMELCDIDQERISRAAYEALERKYTLTGTFLPPNITSLSLSPLEPKMFYIQEDDKGVVGFIYDLIAGSRTKIFESPFTEWTSHWNAETSVELFTKPSYFSDGYSYNLNTHNGRYFKSMPQKKGLQTLANPNNTRVLFNESGGNSLTMGIYDRASRLSSSLSIQTFVDKCTWASNTALYCAVPHNFAFGNQYPDIWYQGLESYTDSLWYVNINGTTELVSALDREYDVHIDVESIAIDSKNNYLYFIDKQTEFLWSYRLR